MKSGIALIVRRSGVIGNTTTVPLD